MLDTGAFVAFDGQKYLNLETYRKSGQGVPTPVWFAAGPGPVLYVYSTRDSGKAKRIRQSGAIKIAPCDARGTLKGQWIDARAEIVSAGEYETGMSLINRKYRPIKQIMDLGVMLFRRHERVVIAIRPL